MYKDKGANCSWFNINYDCCTFLPSSKQMSFYNSHLYKYLTSTIQSECITHILIPKSNHTGLILIRNKWPYNWAKDQVSQAVTERRSYRYYNPIGIRYVLIDYWFESALLKLLKVAMSPNLGTHLSMIVPQTRPYSVSRIFRITIVANMNVYHL